MSTVRVLASIALVSLSGIASISSSPPAQKVRKCGIERWEVKTLSDAGAKKVNIKEPQVQSIQGLASQKSPLAGKRTPPSSRVSALEYKTFTVTAALIGYKLEPDGDFYVVLADQNDRQQIMIAEIPDPQCDGARTSGHGDEYQSARAELIHLLGPPRQTLTRLDGHVVVTITGVGFFDVVHGQTGGAKNGFELHPVLSIRAVK